MFHLYQHHDLDALASVLAVLRQRTPTCSALAPDTVLVPNRGTARWLQATLATDAGVVANVDMPVPGRFVWQMLRDTLPGRPDSTDYERERLAWHLYALLPRLDVPAVQRYLAGEPRERHRYQLAAALADVFDAYLIHRRDVLADWEAGREASDSPAAWQAPVWRALVDRLDPRHRAALMTEFLTAAADGSLATHAVPDPIYAIALVDLPPDYLRLLHALGQYVDVHFLLPNPSAAYWGDAPRRPVSGTDSADEAPAHPLLASFGRAGRDLLQVLYSDELAGVHEPDLGEALAPQPPGDDCLLHRVQSAVIRGAADQCEESMVPDDPSLQIHACHGAWREMQVLQDRLLDLLSRWEDLEARDILVLVPDIPGYAPAIHSVFGAAEGARYLPYRVTNVPRRDRHPIAQTFQQCIELPLSRWTASEVLALAGVPAVRRAFGLDDADLDQLRAWVPAAGVRWGLDRDDRAAHGAAGFEQNSWQFGLDRLLLGISQSADASLVDGVAPWSDLEGGPAAAVGRLWRLLDRLRHWRDRLTEASDAATWQNRLNAMADELFAPDPDDSAEADALAAVHEAIAVLEGADASLAGEELSWEAVREALLGALGGSSQRQPLVSGGITFAGLEPLRGVPFEVIAMVGMDDGVFPRQDGQREFSLLQKHPRPGDPSVRDTERLTFLQALVGARRCFYLSYTGRNRIDGEALKPSPAVGELLDYLHGWHFPDLSRQAFDEAMVTEQPMHPFSPAYFQTEHNGLFTFAGAWREAARAQCAERQTPQPLVDDARLAADTDAPVDLADLQRFFRHPPAWFFRERLGLILDDADERPPDEEPRELDELAKHQLRERLFEQARQQGVEALATEPSPLERAQGHLPPPPLGVTEYAEAARTVNGVLPIYWAWQARAPGLSLDFRLPDGTRVMGRVSDVGADGMRRLRPGPLRAKQLLPWWLAYLAVVASGHEVPMAVVGTDEGELDHRHAAITTAQAQAHLTDAIAWFHAGQTRPLLFEPYVGEHYLDELARTPRSGEPATAEDALRDTNKWLTKRQPPHAARDPWLTPLFAGDGAPLGSDPARATLVTVSEAVLAPMYRALETVEGSA